MKKPVEKEWFKHEYNTRNKTKLTALLHDTGTRGYGLFWIIVEMLYEDSTHWMEISDMTYSAIKRQSGEDLDYIRDFINRAINDYKVFIKKRNRFSTQKVITSLEERAEIRKVRSESGKVGGINSGKSRSKGEAKGSKCFDDAKQNEAEGEGEGERDKRERGEGEYADQILADQKVVEACLMNWGLQLPALQRMVGDFKMQNLSKEWEDLADCKKHFIAWGKYKGKFQSYIDKKQMVH